MENIDITIFCKLLIAHLATDFILQPNSWIKEREQKHFLAPMLYAHGLIAGATVYILLTNWNSWLPAVFIAVTHFIIDGCKSYRKSNLKIFIVDQLLHLLMLSIIWIYILSDAQHLKSIVQFVMTNRNTWIYIAAYLSITTPLGYLIGFATEKWSNQLKDNDGLKAAGKWIGIFERIIILTMILLSQYEAIGLLVAAKSILRFVESKNSEDVQKKSEYVIIGTLISLGLTLMIGLTTKYLLEY